MADSEAKARQKLAEAEKKTKKGAGGFFSSLFGGGGSDEAADLYIQKSSEDAQISTIEEFRCPENFCLQTFTDVFYFEEHYKSAHSFECSECHQKFPNHYILEIHCDESHSTFFQIRLELNPSHSHFRCYAKDCSNRYVTVEERNEHCKLAHSIDDPRIKLEARKMPTARHIHIDEDIKRLSLNESTELGQSQSPFSIEKIKFGEEQERGFEEKRKIATAKRKNKQ